MKIDIIASFLGGLHIIIPYVCFSIASFVVIGLNVDDNNYTFVNEIVVWLMINGIIKLTISLCMLLTLIIMCYTKIHIKNTFIHINLIYTLFILIWNIIGLIMLYIYYNICQGNVMILLIIFFQFDECITNLLNINEPPILHTIKTINDNVIINYNIKTTITYY